MWGYWFKGDAAPSFEAAIDAFDKWDAFPQWRISLLPLGVGAWDQVDEREVALREMSEEYYADIVRQLLQAGAERMGPGVYGWPPRGSGA